jgi:hypothetical protein
MSKLDQATRAVRTVFQQLSNDMTAAIDTGNREAADVTLAEAKSALSEGAITLTQMADISADYNTTF